MRDADGFAPEQVQRRLARQHRLAPVLLIAAVLAAGGAIVLPRAFEAGHLFAIEDDPAAIADRALEQSFDSAVANHEIEAALRAKDSDLAKSFVDLAAERKVAVEPSLVEKTTAAVAEDASAGHAAQSFAYGLVTGEPSDVAGFAGTALGDLFVFGDIRDAVREGSRLATGQQADELVLGLACVGLAITAGTYATFGAAAPVRVGLTVAKVARKTERLSAGLIARVSRMLRGVVDWSAIKRATTSFSITEPQVAVRAARDAVKVERAGGLLDLGRDIGRVQAKAGTQAALDGLKIAESPVEMARVAKLAEKSGSRTRAILKVAGRGAIALSLATFNLTSWIVSALFTLLMFVASLKSMTERGARRYFRYRKRRRMQREAEATFLA
jgi:hypothetical protein